MAEKKIRTEMFTVISTFMHHGDEFFGAGQTVQAGHPILKGRASLFRPTTPDHPWPVEGTAEPEPVPESTPEAEDE